MKLTGKIKVLVIDDSPILCQAIKRLLSMDASVNAVRTATDLYLAQDKIATFRPDVILMDLDMPNLDPIGFLRFLASEYTAPTIVFKAFGPQDSPLLKQALESGAIAYIVKPERDVFIDQLADEIIAKVKSAYNPEFSKRTPTRWFEVNEKPPEDPLLPKLSTDELQSREKVIFIGASTGGTEALRVIFNGLPSKIPPICVVQHLGAKFSNAFARRLNEIYPFEVLEAKEGDLVLPDRVLIAPGDFHMRIDRNDSGQFCVTLNKEPKIWHQRPSVDMLFHSAAKLIGKNAIGVILTGMGQDGADGLLAMKAAGARTIAQDQKSCVVYGMPRVAKERGAVDIVVPLAKIASVLQSYCSKLEE